MIGTATGIYRVRWKIPETDCSSWKESKARPNNPCLWADEEPKCRKLSSAHILAKTAASLAHTGTAHQRKGSDNDHRTSLLGSERTEMFEGLFHGSIDSDSTAVQGLQHFIFQRATTHTVNKLLTRPVLATGVHYHFYLSDSRWL